MSPDSKTAASVSIVPVSSVPVSWLLRLPDGLTGACPSPLNLGNCTSSALSGFCGYWDKHNAPCLPVLGCRINSKTEKSLYAILPRDRAVDISRQIELETRQLGLEQHVFEFAAEDFPGRRSGDGLHEVYFAWLLVVRQTFSHKFAEFCFQFGRR